MTETKKSVMDDILMKQTSNMISIFNYKMLFVLSQSQSKVKYIEEYISMQNTCNNSLCH